MSIRLNFLVCVFLVAASHAFAERPLVEGWTGQIKGQSYFVAPNAGDRLGAEWDPEKIPAPLSVSRAIAAARVSLKSLVGGAEAKFACAEVRLADGRIPQEPIQSAQTTPRSSAPLRV
jgi:hypothetical protein